MKQDPKEQLKKERAGAKQRKRQVRVKKRDYKAKMQALYEELQMEKKTFRSKGSGKIASSKGFGSNTGNKNDGTKIKAKVGRSA